MIRIGFFLVLKYDVQHFLHAASLVREARRHMPGTDVVQFSDDKTPMVPGVSLVQRIAGDDRPLLDQRLQHYALCDARSEWLMVDTDVSIRNDVRGVFSDRDFDVALCDRCWPHLPQGEKMMHEMPFNTGVVFTRHHGFWGDVLECWRAYPTTIKDDWMSEQKAVYDVVRSGRYRIKILPGMHYNYPPNVDEVPVITALAHFKGPRKVALTKHAYTVLGHPEAQ